MKRSIFVIFLMVAVGCGTTTLSLETMTPAQKMALGGRLYDKRCAACHARKDPRSLARGQIVRAVAKYGKKAGLTAAERELVEYYLLRAQAAAPAPGNASHSPRPQVLRTMKTSPW